MKPKLNKKKNKKVRNATEKIVDGIHFKSKLEVYCYEKLREAGIHAKYEYIGFNLLPSFEFTNTSIEVIGKKKEYKQASNKIRPITYTPDFIDTNFHWAIECKGMKTDSFTLKWKMFKYYLIDSGITMDLYMPRNQKQVDKTIELILEKHGR